MTILRSKKFWKILLVLIPTSFFYGFCMLAGILFFISDLSYNVERLDFVTLFFQSALLTGPFGFLGLWIATLNEKTLFTSFGQQNVWVSVFLICGIYSALILASFLGYDLVDEYMRNGNIYIHSKKINLILCCIVIPLLMAGYGGYLVFQCLKPKQQKTLR